MANILIDEVALRQLKILSDAPSDNFSTLTKALRLNPKKAFRHSDLSGVDFTNADLRGFDFSGADLSGAFGHNCRFDKTTKFEAAQVNNSIFSHQVWARRIEGQYPSWKEQFGRLKGAYWLGVTDWAYSKKNLASYSNAERWLIVTKLLEVRKDAIVDLLHVARTIAPSKVAFRAFLLNLLSTSSVNASTIAALAEFIGADFRDNAYCFKTLFSLLRHPSERVRAIAIDSVIASKFYMKNSVAIGENVSSDLSARNRKRYIVQVVNKLSSHKNSNYSSVILSIFLRETILDFHDAITKEFVTHLSTKLVSDELPPLRKEKLLEFLSADQIKQFLSSLREGRSRIIWDKGQHQSYLTKRNVEESMRQLAKHGVPLMITFEVSNANFRRYPLNAKEISVLDWKKEHDSFEALKAATKHLAARKPTPPFSWEIVRVLSASIRDKGLRLKTNQ